MSNYSISSEVSNLTADRDDSYLPDSFSGSFNLSGDFNDVVSDLAPGGEWSSDLQYVVAEEVKIALGLSANEDVSVCLDTCAAQAVGVVGGTLTIEVQYSGDVY